MAVVVVDYDDHDDIVYGDSDGDYAEGDYDDDDDDDDMIKVTTMIVIVPHDDVM